MKVIMFSFSLVILLCMTVILCNAVIKDSPMYMSGVILTSIMFVLSIILTVLTYSELKEDY
nr:MAG TPA: hypothetical protein [Caudoviricetes sp.]